MLCSHARYDAVHAWLTALGSPAHRSVRRARARRLAALLRAQHLTPAALMRALPSPQPVPARTRYAAVADVWDGPVLTAAALTPVLVRAALALARPQGTAHLVLDTVRCGGWETFTIGLVWQGRMVPLHWAVPPSPLPKGVFTPTACARVQQVAAVWPPAVAPPHLVADRGFPSARLVGTLPQVGWGGTVRVRASTWITVVDGPAPARGTVRAQVTAARDGTWTVLAAQFASGRRAVGATLVVGRGLGVVPWHQQGPGSARHRARQRTQRLKDVGHQHRQQAPDASAATDTWMVLVTTHAGWLAAVRSYRQRSAVGDRRQLSRCPIRLGWPARLGAGGGGAPDDQWRPGGGGHGAVGAGHACADLGGLAGGAQRTPPTRRCGRWSGSGPPPGGCACGGLGGWPSPTRRGG